MVIFSSPNGPEQTLFNNRVGKGRMCIERAFGILKQRWRILRSPLKGELHNIELTILACFCLHNYLKDEGVSDPELEDNATEECAFRTLVSFDEEAGIHARNLLVKYMCD